MGRPPSDDEDQEVAAILEAPSAPASSHGSHASSPEASFRVTTWAQSAHAQSSQSSKSSSSQRSQQVNRSTGQQVLLSSPEHQSSPEAQFTGLNPVPAPAPDVRRLKRMPAVCTPPLQPSIGESATPVRKQAAAPPPPKLSVLHQVHLAVCLLLHPLHAVNFASVHSLPPYVIWRGQCCVWTSQQV